MAWLQKRPQVSNPTMFYTVGLNKTVMLIGLGNPGPEYVLTRHNIGFICLDSFVEQNEDMERRIKKANLKSLLSIGRIGESRVVAIKPTTYMNNSGEAVQAAADYYKIQPANIVVIHDDLDIDFGQIRLRIGGQDAGHKGIESISKRIGENYGRIRVGIGPKQPARVSSEKFVLKEFSSTEKTQLPNLTKEVNSILSEYIYGGELPHETRSFVI
ncbi:MAG TPA: aminoacyl-tRNA hydrolase [Candidatus Saccharimonadales bacterium]|nr:aminoacyl-tRNA hydrolase [Candidatus Saccharimonadales bacterium]